ncbi:hypothetical protein [Sphingobacterium composti Ten et al. 2007 non Yoo et al. 2007]|uniref:hypothetical protein n=1 Tax=Sphingobacterium composti TaxID=363260 RepID=UPI00135AAFC6|nr:hypothetical protein [Sphingobacterium composti Ten et al. 2007 non Yoo et al. 2007]
METNKLSTTKRLGPIVCIMIEGDYPGRPEESNLDGNKGLEDEENLIEPGDAIDEILPAGEEENMPDPEEYEERQGDEDLEEIPMEEPVPDIDEIEPDEEIDDFDIEPSEDDEIKKDERPSDEIL